MSVWLQILILLYRLSVLNNFLPLTFIVELAEASPAIFVTVQIGVMPAVTLRNAKCVLLDEELSGSEPLLLVQLVVGWKEFWGSHSIITDPPRIIARLEGCTEIVGGTRKTFCRYC